MFPHSVVPLHIFEPRYRQLLDDALDRVGQLVTATTHPDAEEEQPHDPPPLLPVGCVGQIVDHERLPDGRYNILLQGLCRVEIEQLNEATDERLYRMGRLSPVVDSEADQHDRPEARDLIRIALQGPGIGRMSMADDLQTLLDREEAPLDAIVDLLAHPLLRENMDRSEYLSLTTLPERMALLLRKIRHINAAALHVSEDQESDPPEAGI